MSQFKIILGLLPAILDAVKAVESAIPLSGQGQKKLDLILSVVKQAYDASTELTSAFSWQGLVAVVVPMIANIVELHNQLGLFQKSAQPKTA